MVVKLDILGNFSLWEILEVPALVSGAINDSVYPTMRIFMDI